MLGLLAAPAGGVRAAPPEAPSQPSSRATDSAPPAPDPAAPADPKAAPEPQPLDLGDRVIRKAIVDSRDPMEGVPTSRGAAFGSGGATTAQQGIDRAFREAEIPTCMTADAFRFDPPQFGPFGLGGLLALPFLVHAIATGKCRH